jgi:hypothetical protein
MKLNNLIKKLEKLNIKYQLKNVTEYNKDVEFTINEKTYKAGYTIDNDIIQDYCREICYDRINQEMQRRFFDNFNQLLRYANK